MKNTFYFPHLSELYIGYECEQRVMNADGEDGWIFYRVTLDTDLKKFGYTNKINVSKEIRVPFINKPKFEKEGWIFIEQEHECYYFEKGKYQLVFDSTRQMIKIYEMKDDDVLGYYDGYCKSINEFRTLQKFLKL